MNSMVSKVAKSQHPVRILKVDSSSRVQGSVTRELAAALVQKLVEQYPQAVVHERDVARGALPHVDESWVNANFTGADERNAEQRHKLALSDQLVKELQTADVVVIGVPIYNFSIPAALKAWIDLVARAGVTFRYTSEGPEGLLTGKKAYLVVASGGVAVGSQMDFATSYLRHLLGFIGIEDVELVSADRLNINNEQAIEKARQSIHRVASAISVT